jgi:hypothetical protein
MDARTTTDPVTLLIHQCHRDPDEAERLYHLVAEKRVRRIDLTDGHIELTEKQIGEFVSRFSSEVETALWQSKRLKH